jgi:hypothetical protein
VGILKCSANSPRTSEDRKTPKKSIQTGNQSLSTQRLKEERVEVDSKMALLQYSCTAVRTTKRIKGRRGVNVFEAMLMNYNV